jgi:L-amino acid N-acyltransferase YncA
VSNLSKNRNLSSRGGIPPVVFRKAQSQEVHTCLRLILGTASELASDEQVVDFLRFAMYRGIDLTDIWLADRAGVIVWAILPIVSPGRTMVLFCPPHVAPTLQDTIAPQLIGGLLDNFRARGIHLAQVLIDPADRSLLALFERSGFERLAELIYLSCDLRKSKAPLLPAQYHWERYAADTHATFARTISATYTDSLDCPRLNGRRDVEDILAGHKAVGKFDPKLWFMLLENAEPVGVALLNRAPQTDGVELVYLGLTPRARGRGVSDLLMQHAIHEATTASGRQLTLAVDSQNAPALKLYHRHGLKQICSRIAMLRDLREPTASSPAPEAATSRLL